MTEHVLDFADLDLTLAPRVGADNAWLGELGRALAAQGLLVPDGFALEAHHVAEPLPAALEAELGAAYTGLSARAGETDLAVTVRASACGEVSPDQRQGFTLLNVRGTAELLRAVRLTMASVLRSAPSASGIAVSVQRMAQSSCAGLVTTRHESGFGEVCVVKAAFGLGELLLSGNVDPDRYQVHKPTLVEGYVAIVSRERGDKAIEWVPADGPLGGVSERRVALMRRMQLALEDDEVLALCRWAVSAERHLSERLGQPTPLRIEWARDAQSGKLCIVRVGLDPAPNAPPVLELYRVRGHGKVLLQGQAVGSKVATGKLRVIHSPEELPSLHAGEVLVTAMTDPDWLPVLRRAAAIVTDQGGHACHAAIAARELGIPCVVGARDASALFSTGQEVTISCAEGDAGTIYEGNVPFDRVLLDAGALKMPKTPLMIGLADPERAFALARLPVTGVGLLRTEFVIAGSIGVHPLALLHPERVADAASLAEIRRRAAAYPSPDEFFVDGLASGVAQIAAAFYPRPVIVRMSDFKTDEYARLIGGAAFEPPERNPSLGLRGASRYCHERYREGFALECRALRRVRDAMGLDNVKLMIPFCRTPAEARRVLAELAKNGLESGTNGLEVQMMVELPSNVLLADEFAELFDGFSIGSNDLTQLALGVDRDSSELAPLFDERDESVRKLITMLLEKAHQKGKQVGICGQAPSDHPDFCRFLVAAGIDSITVAADALPQVVATLSS